MNIGKHLKTSISSSSEHLKPARRLLEMNLIRIAQIYLNIEPQVKSLWIWFAAVQTTFELIMSPAIILYQERIGMNPL